MIKAIILDVDGVIIGEKEGFNFPSAHPKILEALRTIREKGIPVILCTAKPHFSVTDIIRSAYLNNVHITDGGAVIIDPIDNKVLEELTLNNDFVRDIVSILLKHHVYTELYTHDTYYIQQNQIGSETPIHQAILQKEAVVVNSLLQKVPDLAITKIMFIAKDAVDKERIIPLIAPFHTYASINWGLHPTALPRQFGFIVNKQTSKKDAAIKSIQSLQINFSDVLGVGDTTGDWKFMEMCGYAATLGNGSDEIKKLVKTKPEGHFYIGNSVDENGLLDILSYFKLSSIFS